MDLERLNKTQIILLTLLVSFVTSIATGIATVSLMERAPTDVTRVISRIVEKPIETIAPNTRTVVEERTVVVSEGERIADAVKRVSPSLVRLYSVSGRDELTFQGIGVIISTDGVVAADARIVDERANYAAMLFDGTRLSAEPSEAAGEQGFFTLDPINHPTPFVKATLAPFNGLVLGQTVVAVSGETATRIAPGVIAELVPASNANEASRLHATIDISGIVLGAPLIDLSGAVIGMPEEEDGQVFISLKETAAQ